MNVFDALILGIVEGVTEFLPISSTGHLILASSLLELSQGNFLKSFEIIIQLGSILAVLCLYWKKFLDIELLKRVIVAFIPTGVIGFALYKVIKLYLVGNESVVLWSLFLGGVVLIAVEVFLQKQKNLPQEAAPLITYKQSFLIGLAQSLAIIPGVSRSGASIVGGLLLGIPRQVIVEFSFLLAVPTMLAATGYDLLKNASSFSIGQFGVLAVGFVTSFLVALASIVFLLRYIKQHDFIAFGIYRIALALLFGLFIWSGTF